MNLGCGAPSLLGATPCRFLQQTMDSMVFSFTFMFILFIYFVLKIFTLYLHIKSLFKIVKRLKPRIFIILFLFFFQITQLFIFSATVTVSSGIALEYIIQLAITQKADPWINIPVLADDDYVMQLAKLLFEQLPSQYRAYIEFSNEIWNSVWSGGVKNYGDYQILI
jgi:hypothetical protein